MFHFDHQRAVIIGTGMSRYISTELSSFYEEQNYADCELFWSRALSASAECDECIRDFARSLTKFQIISNYNLMLFNKCETAV